MSRANATLSRLGVLLALLLSAPVVEGCGGAQQQAATLPKAGDMPEGGDWTGVFFSATYGHLHLVKDGGAIAGRWRNAAGDKWGEMAGEVVGDLFKFEWKETKIGLVGPAASSRGRGYFKYVRPEGEHVNDEIRGEWGLGEEFSGVSWTAVKQRNMLPDLKSVAPDETQRIEGGGWDDQKKSPAAGGDSSGEWN